MEARACTNGPAGSAPPLLFGGASWEDSSLKVEYTSASGDESVRVDLQGGNSFRLTGGAQLDLGLLRLFGDASLGNVTVFSGGLKLGI